MARKSPVAAIKHGGFDCLQIAYSVLDRRLESRVFELAEKMDVGLVARSVLLKGALSNRYRHLPEALSDLKAKVQQLEALASREQMDLPELAYRYVDQPDKCHKRRSPARRVLRNSNKQSVSPGVGRYPMIRSERYGRFPCRMPTI